MNIYYPKIAKQQMTNDSDHFSEIDTSEQVGNVDTLVDDENLESKYDAYNFCTRRRTASS